MAGIQSLMPNNQQAPMPGQAQQAPLPGMMPQQSAATPGSKLAELEASLPPLNPGDPRALEQRKQQLMYIYNTQGATLPLLGKLTETIKLIERANAQDRQNAMASFAQQGPQTVADMVRQQAEQTPVMAAQGGIMQGYAGGGAVAFEDGGETEDLSDDPSLSLRERMARAQKRMALSRQQGIGRSFAERFPAPVESTTDTGDELDRMRNRLQKAGPFFSPEAQELMRRQGPRWSQPEMKERMPEFAQRGTGGIGQLQFREKTSRPAPIPSSDLPPELLKAYAARDAQMRGRLNRPESLVAAEQGLASLARSNIEVQQAEAKAYADDIRAARDAALARSQRDIWSDPMALLTLAGSIDTRKGQAIGSFARGAAGLMGQREAAAEAARKEFAQAQRDERAMQANIRQTQILEAQRQVALEQDKWNKVNEIDEKLAELRMKQEEFRLTRGDKAFDQAMKAKEVGIQESGLKLREREAARGPVPSFQDQLTKSAVESYLKQNPGKTMADAFEWLSGAGKGVEERAEFANLRQRAIMLQNELKGLLESDPTGKSPRIPELRSRLDAIYKELGGTSGVAPTGNASDPLGIRK
jgi:hypothetical protein